MREGYRFSTPVKIRYNETDMQGHVNFGHYLFYFDVALIEYFDAIGYGYEEMLADQADLLYVESHCNYKSPAHWPEVLEVHCRVGKLGNRSIRFEFEVVAEKDGRLVATGHIAAVTADPKTFELRPIPDRFREAVELYQNEA